MSEAVETLSALQIECLSRLAKVRFGVYSSADRIVGVIAAARAGGRPISEAQALALYKICWRYREQIAAAKFMARVLIAMAMLEESMDAAELLGTTVYTRAWRAPTVAPAQGELKIVPP
jgi:hypothetical protein